MRKSRFIWCLLLVFMLVSALSLGGCWPAAAPEPDHPEPEPEVEPAPEVEELHPLFDRMPSIALDGIMHPVLVDRADIPKAWPKTPRDPERIRIGYSKITLGNPWFVDHKEKAQEAAERYGFEVTFLVAEGCVLKQSADIDAFITKGVDIIVTDVVEPLATARNVKRAVEAGIPAIVVGTVPDATAPALTTITHNAYELAFMVGEYVADQFEVDEDIKAASIFGKMGNSTAETRMNAMIGGIVAGRQKAMGKFTSREDAIYLGYDLFEELKRTGRFSYPDLNFHVLTWGTGGWTEEGGLEAAEDILVAVGDEINIMLCGNDFMGMGALRAIEAAGKKGQIAVAAAADGSRQAFELLKTGELMATGSWSGGQVGEGAIEFIRYIFIEGKDPNNLPLASFFPPILFTKDNVHQYWDPDPNNPFYKTPPFEFPKSIPELKAYLEQNE